MKEKVKEAVKHWYAVLFVLIGFIGMGCIVYGFGYKIYEDKFLSPKDASAVKYTGNEYVCDASPEASLGIASTAEKSQQNLVDSLISLINKKVKTYAVASNEMVALGFEMKELTGLPLEFAVAEKPIVIKLPNGNLSRVYEYDEAFRNESVNHIIAFSEYLKNRGTDFVYFENPVKHEDGAYTGFYEDGTNEECEKIRNELRDAGIDVLSVNEEIEKQNMDRDSLFFKTDHHWLPQTGIWATGLLSEKLNEACGFHIDTSLFEESRYSVRYIENRLLGSLGKKVSLAHTQLEDFPVVEPTYETDLTVFNSADSSQKTGFIQETLYNYAAISETELNNIAENNPYGFYGYGDNALMRIHNNKVSDGSRVLVIKTSFANTMYPYLAAGVEYLDVVDLRLFEGSLRAFIDETKPDAVVMCYGTVMFAEDSKAFNFN